MFLCFDLVLENFVNKRSVSIPSRVKSKAKRLESRKRRAKKIRRTRRSLPFSTRCGKKGRVVNGAKESLSQKYVAFPTRANKKDQVTRKQEKKSREVQTFRRPRRSLPFPARCEKKEGLQTLLKNP